MRRVEGRTEAGGVGWRLSELQKYGHLRNFVLFVINLLHGFQGASVYSSFVLGSTFTEHETLQQHFSVSSQGSYIAIDVRAIQVIKRVGIGRRDVQWMSSRCMGINTYRSDNKQST